MKKYWLALATLFVYCSSFAADTATRTPIEINVPDEVINSLQDEYQKEALRNLIIAARNNIQLVSNIQLNPPTSRFDLNDAGQIVDVSKLFIEPSADRELLSNSQNPDGSRKMLSAEQISQIRENAYFIVPSLKYPGQNYVWQLSAFFQIGAKNIKIYIDRANTSALRKVTVWLPMAVLGKYNSPISVKDGISSLLRSVLDTLSLAVGLVETRPRYTDYDVRQLIEKEKTKYKSVALTSLTLGTPGVDLPTPGFVPDLRLFNDELMDKALPRLRRIDEKMTAVWGQESYTYGTDRGLPTEAVELRQKIRSQLINSGVPLNAVEDQMKIEFAAQRERAYHQALLEDKSLNELSEGLGRLVVNRAKALSIMAKGEARLAQEVADRRQLVASQLAAKHPVRGQIPEWVSEKADAAANEFYQSITADRYAAMAAEMRQAGLAQEAFLFEKNVEFVRTQEKQMEAELKAQVVAANEYVFTRPISRPENWEVTKEQVGEDKTIYHVEKVRRRTIQTTSWLWRLQNLLAGTESTVAWTVHGLLYANLWNGPVGLKSLFKVKEFPTNPRINKEGKVEYTSTTGTMISRLRSLSASLREEREAFENRTTHGFFGKSFSRNMLRVKHAALRYGGGTALVVGQIAGTAVNATASTVVAGTSIVWSPILNLTLLGFINPVIYDFYSPKNMKGRGFKGAMIGFFSNVSPVFNRILIRSVAIKGIGQTVVSLIAAPALLAASGAEWAWSNVRGTLFSLNDALMRGIMKNRVGVPASTVRGVVTLTAGPGLSRDYFYQIEPSLVAVAAWARLEQLAFAEYRKSVGALIESPEVQYREFTRVFGAFIGFNAMGEKLGAVQQIQEAKSKNEKVVNKALDPYEEHYQRLLNFPDANIRMTAADLATAQAEVAKLAQEFMAGAASNWNKKQLSEFWQSRNLQEGDWTGLSRSLMTEIFHADFLVPLEQIDQSFRLRVDGPSLSRLAEAVLEGRNVDGRDVISVDRAGSDKTRVVFCSALLGQ